MIRKRRSSKQTLLVLAALLQQPQAWLHGYRLASLTGLQSGTLYPILMRLTERGYLESEWRESDQPGRPPRQLYRLTPTGVAFANDELHLKTGGEPRRGAAAAT